MTNMPDSLQSPLGQQPDGLQQRQEMTPEQKMAAERNAGGPLRVLRDYDRIKEALDTNEAIVMGLPIINYSEVRYGVVQTGENEWETHEGGRYERPDISFTELKQVFIAGLKHRGEQSQGATYMPSNDIDYALLGSGRIQVANDPFFRFHDRTRAEEVVAGMRRAEPTRFQTEAEVTREINRVQNHGLHTEGQRILNLLKERAARWRASKEVDKFLLYYQHTAGAEKEGFGVFTMKGLPEISGADLR